MGAHRQSVSKWAAELQAKGRAGLKKAGRAGRKPRLSAEQISQMDEHLPHWRLHRRELNSAPLGYETWGY